MAGMTMDELAKIDDPRDLSLPLQALWHDGRGDWDRAHELCQRSGDRAGDRVHAYLHRKEGDAANAAYWYARARSPVPPAAVSLDDERASLVGELSR